MSTAQAALLEKGNGVARPGDAVILVLLTLAPVTALAQPRITRGPYLQSLLSNSVEVCWTTDELALGSVRYRAEGGVVETADEEGESTDHRVRLDDLLPGTAYAYEVMTEDTVLAGGDGFYFRTAPPTGTGTVRAAVVGDSGDPMRGAQRRVASVVEDLTPEIFLHTGDLIYTGNEDEAIFAPYRMLFASSCFYPARGNHSNINPGRFLELFSLPAVPEEVPACELPASVCPEDPPLPARISRDRSSTFYSFDWGPAHFAFLDSNSEFSGCSAQMKWLCYDLHEARAHGRPWIVVVLHHTVYTAGAYSIEEHDATRLIPPIADRFGVDLVLSGHDHNYQRTYPLRSGRIVDGWQEPSYLSPGGTVYLVTGGGGAGLYLEEVGAPHRSLLRVFASVHHAVELEISPERMRARAIAPPQGPGGVGAGVVDAFEITKDGRRYEPGFLRGDVRLDGDIDITDAVLLLGVLFLGEGSDCPPAFPIVADTDGSRAVDITDAIYLLHYLFLGGAAPVAPFQECEPVPDLDLAGCFDASCTKPVVQ